MKNITLLELVKVNEERRLWKSRNADVVVCATRYFEEEEETEENEEEKEEKEYNTIQYKSQFVTRHTSQGESEARG